MSYCYKGDEREMPFWQIYVRKETYFAMEWQIFASTTLVSRQLKSHYCRMSFQTPAAHVNCYLHQKFRDFHRGASNLVCIRGRRHLLAVGWPTDVPGNCLHLQYMEFRTVSWPGTMSGTCHCYSLYPEDEDSRAFRNFVKSAHQNICHRQWPRTFLPFTL